MPRILSILNRLVDAPELRASECRPLPWPQATQSDSGEVSAVKLANLQGVECYQKGNSDVIL